MKSSIMKYHISLRFAIIVALLSLAACQKDEERVDFALRVADRYNAGGSKVYMDGNTPKFAKNEAVKINGETYLVDTRSGSPAVYDVAKASAYYAIFPASWVNGSASSTPSVTFPVMQVYKTDDEGHQLVENPMVAYTTEDGAALNFYNVASLAKVHIVNNYGSSLKIKYVALYTDDTPLSGPASISGFTGSTPEVSLTSGITNVSIDCAALPTLTDGNSVDVTFSLPPIESVVLYVDVYMTSPDEEETTKYSFTKKTANGKTIHRNEMGVINVTLNNGSNPDDVKTCGAFWGGGGSEDDPFIIMNKKDLERLQTLVAAGDDGTYNAPNRYYLQTANIDLGDELAWSGIGTSTYPFEANYDGSEALVTLNIYSETGSTGVFGYVGSDDDDTFIKNLRVKGQITNSAEQAVGSVCGTVVGDETVTIENCTSYVNITGTYGSTSTAHIMGGIVGNVTAGEISINDCDNHGTITKTYGYAGGILGHVASTATGCLIDGCTNDAQLKSYTTGYMGGICGYAEHASTIQNCINEGLMVGRRTDGGTETSLLNIGGIAGYVSRCVIDRCTNTGVVTGYQHVGGIVGYIAGGTVSRCHNTADVTGYSAGVGGIVGYAYTAVLTIDGCLNEGSIAITGSPSQAEVAGIIGYSNVGLTIKNTGNRGNVNSNGQKNAVGLCGRANANTTVVNCFERATLTATGSFASGMVSSYSSGLTMKFRNCYVYDQKSASAYASLYNRLSNSLTVNQAYCYSNVVTDAVWGNSTSKTMMNAYSQFTVSGTGPYTVTCTASKTSNKYWKTVGKNLLVALNDWCETPLDNDESTAYGSSSDYLTWKADSDGFPTLNFDFIENSSN